MIIPEDGSLPKITRTGFTPFNNVMVIKLPNQLEEKGKAVYNLVTLDSSKKDERWPAENCSTETIEMNKESNVPKLTVNKVNSRNIRNPKANTMNKRKNFFRKKVLQKRQKIANNKQKFVRKNIAETKKYHDVPADKIDPWLPGSALSSADNLPPIYNHTLPNFHPPLLGSKGLLGNGPNDLIKSPLISNVPLINNTLQNMLSRNIASTNLSINECHGNRELPPVNTSFDNTYNTNFRNKLLPSDKYDHRFDEPYRDGSELFPYDRNYSNTERDKSSISSHFTNRFETHIGSAYDSNYIADPAFRNHSYDDFDANHRAGLPEDRSHGIDPLNRLPGPPNEIFMGTERDFPGDAIDGSFANSYRNSHSQNKFRNGSSEAFQGPSGDYDKDISYNTSYNERPRKNFSKYSSFRNDFRNNSADKQRKNLNESGYMRSNRDYNSNRRGSKDGSPLDNSYENYTEMHRENPTNFYGPYENERSWDNVCEPNTSFHDNYRRDRKSFHKRNKNVQWRKDSPGNSRQNRSTRERNKYRLEKRKS